MCGTRIFHYHTHGTIQILNLLPIVYPPMHEVHMKHNCVKAWSHDSSSYELTVIEFGQPCDENWKTTMYIRNCNIVLSGDKATIYKCDCCHNFSWGDSLCFAVVVIQANQLCHLVHCNM